ncbi:MAG: DUF1223 domain-containing protein [Phycisphaerales bacterium]
MIATFVATTVAVLSLQFALADRPAAPEMPKAKKVTVVELFTSEGCSSCPPADRVLSELIAQHAKAQDLIALSFHVDYWNNLGWSDPWSTAEATTRQAAYRDSLGDRSLYTPEIVVGGAVGFVGSDRTRAEQEVASDQLRADSVVVALSAAAKAAPKPAIAATIKLTPDAAEAKKTQKWTVLVALFERDLTSNVRRGENAGQKLTHDNVVRVFKMAELTAGVDTVVELPLPEGFRPDHGEVIALVQAAPGKPVIGAARCEAPAALPASK